MSRRLHVPLAILLGVVARFPFWVEALRTPLDGDTAIVGLMARHLGQGTTMWGQPYGSPLEAALAAPFVALLGPTTGALRLFYFLTGLALIPLAYALGRALHPAAAFPAAVLMAFPPPYFLLMASLPPPLYPTVLLLCGALLLLALRLGDRQAEGARPVVGLAAWGLMAGLALWTHPVSGSVVAAGVAFLFARTRGRRWLFAGAFPPLLVASAPWWTRLIVDREAAGVLSLSRREMPFWDHLGQLLVGLPRPLGALLGTHVPVIPDAGGHVVHAPAWAAVVLVLTYGSWLIRAARASRGRGPAGLLLGAAALGILAFLFPHRAGPNATRFLTPVYWSILVLVAWAPLASCRDEAEEARGARRSWIVVLTLCCFHLLGAARLLGAWRGLDRAAAPFLLPDLAPVRQALESRGIRRAYASYGPAYRLTYESGERILVSQPWNERFRHHPLPYLDEVRFAKNVAWVLTPGIPSDLPLPQGFESSLGAIGGVWKRTQAGPAAIYHGFVPPFAPTVVALSTAGPAGDGDLGTRFTASPGQAATFRLAAPESLDAVTLVAGLEGPRLPRSMDVDVSADGVVFETVARRRRREERQDLRWLGGHPQPVLDHDVLAIPFGGRKVAALRITPTDPEEPWALAEILLHPAVEPARRAPWDEWLDPSLTWPERRAALAAQPRRDREDWYSRSLLAARHR